MDAYRNVYYAEAECLAAEMNHVRCKIGIYIYKVFKLLKSHATCFGYTRC